MSDACETCRFEDFWKHDPASGIPALRNPDPNKRRLCTAECSDEKKCVTEIHELTNEGWKVTTEKRASIDGAVDISPSMYEFVKKRGCRLYSARAV